MARIAHKLNAADISPVAEASFWSLVDMNLMRSCWLWKGMKSPNGYGRFKIGKVKHGAHRVSYALSYGYCPRDLVVRHACDNPLCVAPHHLSLGTDAENIADRCLRQRTARGSRGGMAILTDVDVRAILADKRIARVIANDYGVHKSTVAKVKSGRNWKHIHCESKAVMEAP